MANLIKTSDKRQSFTHNEVLQIALALKDRTEVLSSGTDYTYEGDNKYPSDIKVNENHRLLSSYGGIIRYGY